jgi:hypothetical protein
LDLDRDWSADRHVVGQHFHGHVDAERIFGQKPAALLDDDVVLEAEIIGRDKRRCNAAGRIALHGRDAVSCGPVLAAEILCGRNFPASRHRRPYEIEILSRGETLARHRDRRADRSVRGRDPELSDEAARRLREWRRRAEFG